MSGEAALPWRQVNHELYSSLLYLFLFLSLCFSRFLSSLSFPSIFPFLSISSLSLSFSLVYLPARVYESFPLLESPICSLSSCLYLHLCLRSCSTSLVTSRLPTLLESIPLFLSLLSSYLSFFLSFFGRFSQLSLFSSLTPYTCEIRRDNSAVCLLPSQHKPHLSTCLRFMAFLPPLGFLSSSRIQAQFLSFSSTVFPRTYFPLLEGTV